MKKAVFLDRDGTLIRNHHYGCNPNEIELLEGVPKGLRLLKRAGYYLVLVTNQSGIARGFFTEGQLAAMHRRLGAVLEEQGVGIDGWYYCPHHPDGVVPEYSVTCDCRKPRPGLLLRAAEELGIDLRASYLIGDAISDMEAGVVVGCRTILVMTGRGARQLLSREARRGRGYSVSRNLSHAVRRILAEQEAGRSPHLRSHLVRVQRRFSGTV